MIEEIKGGEISYSYTNTKLDYNIKSTSVDDYNTSIEFKAIKELLIEENLIYVTEFIRDLLKIKKTNDLTCFKRINPDKIAYKKEYGKKTILYVRLSVEDLERKDGSGNKISVSKSILNQLLMQLQYCKDYQMEVVGIFYEEDISGGDESRPEWNKSLKFCENGHTDVYICKTQSRFARDVEMIEKYLHKRFLEWNIRFLSIVDHSDTAVRGNKLQRQITAIVDENKIAEQSVNVKATLKGKNKAGQWTGSFACYGYIEDPNDMYHLIPDPSAAKVVQTIYELHAKGLGYFRICQYLNEKNIPTPSKYKKLQGSNFVCARVPNGTEYWNTDTIARILRNETYDGILIQNRTETISHNIKKKRKVPKNEQTIIACCHERILDPVISRIVRDKFSARAKTKNNEITQSRAKPTKSGEVHIFSQKVYCECCGKIFQKTSYRRGSKDSPLKLEYLVCKKKRGTCGAGCDNNSSVRIDVLEEIILKEINKQIDKYYNQTKFEKSYYENKVNSDYKKDVTTLEKEKNILDKKIKEQTDRFALLYEDRANGVITTIEFGILKEKYNNEITSFTNRVNEINEEIVSLEKKKEQRKEEQSIFKEYQHLKKLDRLAVETFISKILVGKINPETKKRAINIIWNICSS
ncbi:MAG: recombinase family protein [Oscillospiraceae bacterium]|nr:recombinase family protein [Oscillospiraceae bacterium]